MATEIERARGVSVVPIPADLIEMSERERLLSAVEDSACSVSVLVNNAGFGSSGPFARQDPRRQADMVALNCEAVVHLTGGFLPTMIESRSGAVLNIASSAAFQPMPLFATYGATKAFVLSFSAALHAEAKPHGVTVTACCPGPVPTEFGKVAGTQSDEDLPLIRLATIDADQVAEESLRALEHGKREVVPGLGMRVAVNAMKPIPTGTKLKVMERLMSRLRQ